MPPLVDSSQLTLHLFGSPTISRSATRIASFRSAKSVALLTYLAVEWGRLPSRSALATLLWSEQSEHSARKNLTQTLRRLRQDIGDDAKSSRYFSITLNAIGLRTAAEISCDVTAFCDLVAATKTHEHGSTTDCAPCLTRLREAVALADGEFLAGFEVGTGAFGFEEWLFLQREQLHQMRLDALHTLTAGLLKGRAYDDAAQYARQQLAIEPWLEKAHRQLMTALAHRGDRQLALQQFERCQRSLEEELGLAPSRKTVALYEQIRAGSLQSAEPSPVATVQERRQHNIPAALNLAFGQELLLAELIALQRAAAYRLISLVGPGGVGKTRLALSLARSQLEHFRDGVYFVDLLGVHAADSIPTAIADALGLPLNHNSTHLERALLQLLRDRKMLLILDNFEHLLDGAEIVRKLLTQLPEIHLLVTTREALQFSFEFVYPVRGLPLPPANASVEALSDYAVITLFVDRAHRVQRAFKLTDANRAAVVQLCTLVAGLPLGVELAATHMLDYTAAQIVAGIKSDAAFLATTLRDVPHHHRSMRAVFDWSWRLLSVEQQSLLAALSIFRGSFDADAACQVAHCEPAALMRLRSKSLLSRLSNQRYGFHELLRQFAAQHLRPSDRSRQVEEAFSTLYLQRITNATPQLDTSTGIAQLSQFVGDLPNIRAAWQLASTTQRLPLLRHALPGTAYLLERIGYPHELIEICRTTLAALEGLPACEDVQYLQAALHTYTGRMLGRAGDTTLSEVELAQGKRLNSADDRNLQAWNQLSDLQNLASSHRYADALARFPKLISFTHERQLPLIEIMATYEYGLINDMLGNEQVALQQFERVIALHAKNGRGVTQAVGAHAYVALIEADNGQFERAINSLLACVDRLQNAHAPRALADVQHKASIVARNVGLLDLAVELGSDACATMTRIGDNDAISRCFSSLSLTLFERREAVPALASARKSYKYAQASQSQFAIAYALSALANAAALANDWGNALRYINQAISISDPHKDFDKDDKSLKFARVRLLFLGSRQTDASIQLEPLLDYLPAAGVPFGATALLEPLRCFMIADQVLAKANDPRRPKYLQAARPLLEAQIAQFSDERVRHSYIQRCAHIAYLRQVIADTLGNEPALPARALQLSSSKPIGHQKL
jgi:predicted ATPase